MIENTLYLIIVGAVAAATSIFLIFPLFAIYEIVFKGKKEKKQDHYALPMCAQTVQQQKHILSVIDGLINYPYEEVSIRAKDGGLLFAKYFHVLDGAPVDICFHGYHGTGIRDMSGYAKVAMDVGHNLLIVDMRAHGKSKGRYLTFGQKESVDCKRWVNYVINRFGGDVKICLSGVSMGASTILMANRFSLPNNVKCMVADSPYASPKDILISVLEHKRLKAKLLYPIIAFSGMLFGGVSLPTITADDAVKQSNIPTLIIHGEEDSFVPCSMSEKIALARDGIERHVFKGAEHVGCSLTDTPRYTQIVQEFITKHTA